MSSTRAPRPTRHQVVRVMDGGVLLPMRSGYETPSRLAIQPQRSHTTAVVEGVVGAIVFHIWLPGGSDRNGVRIHIVLLFCHIALNRKNDLPTRLQVFGLPLFLEHGRELRVVDIASIHRMVWDESPIQWTIWVYGEIDGPIYHTLVLALCRRRHIGAVLLQLQLDLDAHVFEEALHELHRIHEVTPQARGRRELRFKALGIPGFCQ